MLVRKVVQRYPAIWKYRAHAKRALFAALSGHDLGAKRELHLRPGPNSGLYRIILLLLIKHRDQVPLGLVSFCASPFVA